QLEVDRQGADLQRRRQFLRLFETVFAGEAARDLGPVATVDPVRVFAEVDDRAGLDFVVEDDREVTGEGRRLFGRDRADRLRLAALGDPPGDFVEGRFAVPGEAEGDVRFAAVRAVFLLRVGDVVAREGVFVFQREPARLRGFVDFAAFVAGRFGDQD